ncbi:hypothetical protein EBB59_02985 [Lysobacter pythonis]|uniref:Uncharacterized protein n=1 Tax=Solilutibacter pythonis TaxID=2483112 RepID=A0A3M2I793_9GAMM|nr:hypothetical protein [Lysobacter pythonis]RMH94144.1 hypothetical protein EBB59_02985 [Lysobacter pythonis]
MHPHEAQETLKAIMTASGRLERLSTELTRTSHQAQTEIRETRAREEAHFREAMVAQFEETRQRMEAALRPKIAWAWQALAVLVGTGILLLGGFAVLLGRANERLRVAEARADGVEVRAEVQAALRQVEITTCGGRSCIRLDRRAPVWKNASGEYVLVDGKPGEKKSAK